MFAIAFCLGMLWGCFGLATFLIAIRDIRARRAASSKFVRAVAGSVSTPVPRVKLRLVSGGKRREQGPFKLSGGGWA